MIPTPDAGRYKDRLCDLAGNPKGYAAYLRDLMAAELGGRSPYLAKVIRSRAQPIVSAPYPAPRYGCRLCAAGDVIRQVAHDAENLCLKHPGQMVWVGPGTDPDSQRMLPYDRQIAQAERLYRRRSAAGRFNPDLTARAWEMIRDNARLSHWAAFHPVLSKLRLDDRRAWETDARCALYPATVALAELLTDQRDLSIWLNPARSHGELRELFTTALLSTGLYPCGIRDLVERMLLHLRPLRQRAATWNENPKWREAAWLWEQDLTSVDTTTWCNASQSTDEPIKTDRCIDFAMYDLLPRKPLAIDEWDWRANGCASPWTAEPTLEAWYVCQTCHVRYQARTRRRARGSGCQICHAKQVIPGVNDLASRRPDIAAEWDPTVGVNTLTPQQVPQHSQQKMGWICARCGHRWRTSVASRNYAGDCKQCAVQRLAEGYTRQVVEPGINDLATLYPDLAAQWDPSPGANWKTPQQLTATCFNRITWVCPTCTGRWTARVSRRVAGSGCPFCAGKQVRAGYNDLATLRPDLAHEWDDTPGANVKTPQQVTSGSSYLAAWVCRVCGARWDAMINDRSRGSGCPCCAGRLIWVGHNDLASQRPDLAAEWDAEPDANSRSPQGVSLHSNYRATWCCRTCHQRWRTRVATRTSREGADCPKCAHQPNHDTNPGKPIPKKIYRWLAEP